MSQDYGYSKTWVTVPEVQEMLEGIGVALVTDDLSKLARSREIGATILSDLLKEEN